MHNSVFPFALEELRANFDQEESFTIKSMRRKGFTNFFGRMDRQFKITEFFQFLMKGFKKMDIRKFIDYIDGGYGIKYDKKKLTYLISQGGMYYDSTMKKIYLNKEEYYEDI